MCFLCELAAVKLVETFLKDLSSLNRDSVIKSLQVLREQKHDLLEHQIMQRCVGRIFDAALEAAENIDKLQVAPPNNIENN